MRSSLLQTMKKHSARLGLIALLATVPLMVSCYGRFPLTRAVYNFNGRVGGEVPKHHDIVVQAVFWVFVILPVYGIAAIGDAIIFNLIEFWTGETLEVSQVTHDGNRTVSLQSTPDGKEAVLTISKKGQVVATERFVRVSPTLVEARDADGKVNGMVIKNANGGLDPDRRERPA